MGSSTLVGLLLRCSLLSCLLEPTSAQRHAHPDEICGKPGLWRDGAMVTRDAMRWMECEGAECTGEDDDISGYDLTSCTAVLLDQSGMDDSHVAELAEHLERNRELKVVSLASNSIGADGARALAWALERNPAITSLHLDHNFIGDEGARALARVVEKTSTITTLNLVGNSIGDDGARALAAALETKGPKMTLYLDHNSISDEGRGALQRAIEKKARSLQLDLAGTIPGKSRNQPTGVKGIRIP
jgi:hypothetical protein